MRIPLIRFLKTSDQHTVSGIFYVIETLIINSLIYNFETSVLKFTVKDRITYSGSPLPLEKKQPFTY